MLPSAFKGNKELGRFCNPGGGALFNSRFWIVFAASRKWNVLKGLHYLIEFLSRHATVLLALYCVLVLIVTLAPFNFTMDSTLLSHEADPIEWIPFSPCPHCGELHIKDKILNTIMFMPFGILLALRRIGNVSKIGILLLIPFWGFAFSLGIEATQFFFPPRTPSASDVMLNTLGAFLGAQFTVIITKEVYKRAFNP